jgi:hypothetical protein
MLALRLFLLVGPQPAAARAESSSGDASKIHLLADPAVVAAMDGAAITFGPVIKSAKNPLIVEDRPWEGEFGNCYPTAAFDPADRKFKVWLNARTRCPPTGAANDPHTAPGICPHLGYPEKWKQTLLFKPTHSGEQRAATLYAEADDDGLSFTKPSLGLHEWNGSTANNIVMETLGNAGVFLDLHETNESRRFKLISSYNKSNVAANPDENNQYTLITAVSADGKVWTDITNASSMRVAADTANNALYDPHLGTYLAFSRRHCSHCTVTSCEASCGMSGWGVRRETRSTSTSFLGGWTDAVECAHGEPPVTYEMYSLTPFRSEHWRP